MSSNINVFKRVIFLVIYYSVLRSYFSVGCLIRVGMTSVIKMKSVLVYSLMGSEAMDHLSIIIVTVSRLVRFSLACGYSMTHSSILRVLLVESTWGYVVLMGI